MMQNVHLAPETDEDDLYSGYNDYNPTYDTEVKKKKFVFFFVCLFTLVFANQLVHENFGFEGSALSCFRLSKLIKSLEKCYY